MPAKKRKSEKEVIALLTTAKGIADDVFGLQSTTDAVHDVYDWLEMAPNAEELVADLKRIYEHAGRIHKTAAPTPDQVFGLFELVYGEDD